MMYGLGQPYDVWFRGKKIPSRFWWKFTLSKKFTTENKLLGGVKSPPILKILTVIKENADFWHFGKNGRVLCWDIFAVSCVGVFLFS